MPLSLSLVADVGGTNTRVALARGTQLQTASLRKFRNADFAGIDAVLARFMADEGVAPPAGACVAGAGPVMGGAVVMTNLFDDRGQPWIIDPARVSAATGAGRVAILNDLQAQGHALGHLAADQVSPLVPGPQVAGAAMLVVGLGTGVNAAPVHLLARGRVVPPSECGHVNLPVRSEDDLRLMRWLETTLARAGDVPHASVEEVLSGRGLGHLHAFAAEEAGSAARADSAGVLAGLTAGDPLAQAAARLYARILGQMLADQALIHLPYGGIFLIGGMARAMAPHLPRLGLAAAFREPRRVPLLQHDFAISVVQDDFAALTGCAAHLAAGAGGA